MQVCAEVRDKDEVRRRRLQQYLGVIVDLLDETSERTDGQTDGQTDRQTDTLIATRRDRYWCREQRGVDATAALVVTALNAHMIVLSKQQFSY